MVTSYNCDIYSSEIVYYDMYLNVSNIWLIGVKVLQ